MLVAVHPRHEAPADPGEDDRVEDDYNDEDCHSPTVTQNISQP